MLIAVGILSWIQATSFAALLVWRYANLEDPPTLWLYDWHVYAAGARDLLDGDLYQSTLTFPGRPLPVETYNLPVFSAAIVVPLLVLPDIAGGIVWIAINAVAWAVAWFVGLTMAGVRRAWAWTGIALVAYSFAFYWFPANLLLGNVNHLVLGVIAVAVLALHSRRDRLAGVALGLAIAIKLWPAVLLLPLLRDRRWSAVAVAVGTAAIATAVPFLWLGLDAVAPFSEAIRLRVPIEPGVAVLWTTAFRLMWDWWPAWGAAAVAIGLLAIPVRGLPGIGLAIIAGISVIPNIWDHYLPTVALGLFLAAPAAARIWRAVPSRSPMVTGQASADV